MFTITAAYRAHGVSTINQIVSRIRDNIIAFVLSSKLSTYTKATLSNARVIDITQGDRIKHKHHQYNYIVVMLSQKLELGRYSSKLKKYSNVSPHEANGLGN